MLQQIFEQLGFFPTLFFVLGCFFGLIFWMAGIAGIVQEHGGKPAKAPTLYALCILVPPYPVIWLLIDIVRQAARIRSKKKKAPQAA